MGGTRTARNTVSGLRPGLLRQVVRVRTALDADGSFF